MGKSKHFFGKPVFGRLISFIIDSNISQGIKNYDIE